MSHHQSRAGHKSKQKVPKGSGRGESAKSIEGLEASDLPDARGSVESDYGKEAGRDVPQHHGGPVSGEDTGIRGDAAVRRAARHGPRGRD